MKRGLRALLLLACASQFFIGCGGEDECADGEDCPATAECTSSDLKLADQTAAVGQTVVPLGSLELVQAGEGVYATKPFGLCLPPDVVSVELLPGGMFPYSWRSNGTELLPPAPDLYRWVTPEFMLPRAPTVPLLPGHHDFRITSPSGGQLSPTLVIRRGQRSDTGQFRINFVLVAGAGLTDSEWNALLSDSSVFDNLYAAAGLQVSEARVGSINDSSFATVSPDRYAALSTAQITPSGTSPMFTDAVTIYVVRQVNGGGNSATTTTAGESMGIPGAAGVAGKSGVVMSVDAHRKGGVLQPAAFWGTLAHELGHWHGLRHTSERDGKVFDLIGDTPECPPSADSDGDGLLMKGECLDKDGNNLMFWNVDLDSPPTVVSQGQAFALSAAATVSPR